MVIQSLEMVHPIRIKGGAADDMRGEGLLYEDLVRGEWLNTEARATAQLPFVANGAGLASTLVS